MVEREALKGPRRGRRGRLCRHGKAKIAALLPHWVYDQHSGLAFINRDRTKISQVHLLLILI